MSLTLYSLSSELTELLELRAEMVVNSEDTTTVDHQLREYLARLPEKVDAVAAVLRTMDSQIDLAKAEEHRLKTRRQHIEAGRQRLESYVKEVLSSLPEPKRGKTKKLVGATCTLTLRPNGGSAPLEIQDPAMVPDEYCTATVTMPWLMWDAMTEGMLARDIVDLKPKREPSNAAIRKALEEDCWDCSGTGGPTEASRCPACGGSGKQGVAGCRLGERGFSLKIE
jgi:hypothetical protein